VSFTASEPGARQPSDRLAAGKIAVRAAKTRVPSHSLAQQRSPAASRADRDRKRELAIDDPAEHHGRRRRPSFDSASGATDQRSR